MSSMTRIFNFILTYKFSNQIFFFPFRTHVTTSPMSFPHQSSILNFATTSTNPNHDRNTQTYMNKTMKNKKKKKNNTKMKKKKKNNEKKKTHQTATHTNVFTEARHKTIRPKKKKMMMMMMIMKNVARNNNAIQETEEINKAKEKDIEHNNLNTNTPTMFIISKHGQE